MSTPSMELIKNGRPKISKFRRDEYGRTERVHAYITLGPSCNSNCGFCRNKEFNCEIMKHNSSELIKTLEKYSPYIYSFIFGGGEPLLYADELYEILSDTSILNYDIFDDEYAEYNINSYIVTNGTRELFLKEIAGCRLCKKLNGIMLSRHHYDDAVNAQIFNNASLITSEDIKDKLCSSLKDKMELVITCLKGYIDSVDEILKFIEWGKEVGIQKFLFNDLQKDITIADYWNEHQINPSVFTTCEEALRRLGYELKTSRCSSSGYDIVTYIKDDVTVGFKRYHQTTDETTQKWQNSQKFTYDLSIMPNGELYNTWTNKDKI